MTHETVMARSERTRADSLVTAAAACLPVLAIAAACAAAFMKGLPIVIERPSVLIAASILILLPSRRELVRILQSVTALYLVCVLINEAHLRYVAIPGLSAGIRISCSVVPLALLATGCLADRWTTYGSDGRSLLSSLRGAWVLAGGIVIAHMAVLGLLLHRFYGYGYEQDLRVLGSLALYYLVFLGAWRPLGRPWVRRAAGLLLIIFYAAAAAGKV